MIKLCFQFVAVKKDIIRLTDVMSQAAAGVGNSETKKIYIWKQIHE